MVTERLTCRVREHNKHAYEAPTKKARITKCVKPKNEFYDEAQNTIDTRTYLLKRRKKSG